MSRRSAEILLAAVIVARSTSLLFAKMALRTLAPLNLLAVRFLLAFAILCLIFMKKLRQLSWRDLGHGALLGASFFSEMVFEMFALRASTPSTTSFLENTAVVLVPLLGCLYARRAPEKRTLLMAALALFGVGCLTLGGGAGAIGIGHLLGIVTAVCYANTILLTGRLSRQGDALLLGILQVGFLGLYALVGSLLFEAPRLPQGGTEWGAILELCLVCTCFGFTFQPVAQKRVSAALAGQFCALNPLSVFVLSIVFLREPFSPVGALGGLCILGSILLQNLHLGHHPTLHTAAAIAPVHAAHPKVQTAPSRRGA